MAEVVERKDGVAWPEKSTTKVGRRVWGAAIEAMTDHTAKGACAGLLKRMNEEKDWRHKYNKHLGELAALMAQSTEAAYAHAEAGLDAIHKEMKFNRGDITVSVMDAVAGNGIEPAPVETVTIDGAGAPANVGVPITVGSNSMRMEGEILVKQVAKWTEFGAAVPSVVQSIEAVTSKSADDLAAILSSHVFFLIGATSELCPCRPLLSMGATVVAVARPGKKLDALAEYAKTTAGTLLVPRIGEKTGLDIMAQVPELGSWFTALGNEHANKKLFVGAYVYLDGEANVRCTASADAVWAHMVSTFGDRVCVGLLASPGTAHIWPEESYQKALQAWAGRPWWSAFGFSNSTRTLGKAPRRIFNGMIVTQGPNYALAQTMRLWRCILARSKGCRVSANMAPPCRTASMTNSSTMRVALDGMQVYTGFVVLQAPTCSALMGLLTISDLESEAVAADPTAELAHPYDLFSHNSFDGGGWQLPYKQDTLAFQARIMLNGKMKAYPGTEGLLDEVKTAAAAPARSQVAATAAGPAKKVLMVCTSAGDMGGTPTGTWLEELATPYYLFTAQGVEVTMASPAGGMCPIDAGSMKGDFFTAEARRFMHDQDAFAQFSHTVTLTSVEATITSNYDCIYLVGGHGCCVDFVNNPTLKSCIEQMYTAGMVVAADCHGPIALADCEKADGTPLVAGLKVCCFTNAEEKAAGALGWVEANSFLMESRFKEQGATFASGPDWDPLVQVAGNLITAQNPASGGPCAMKVLGMLA